jgi:3-methyladenine DNA glycosylase AlkD
MQTPSTQTLQQLTEEFATHVQKNQFQTAAEVLKPILNTKCPFSKLDLLGKLIGSKAKEQPERFLQAFDRIIDSQAMGGFVVVGESLVSLLETDFEATMHKSREYIIKGATWYVCDIIGERSIGKAVVKHFERTLPYLKAFLEDDNKWVKRSAGVAIHFFAKRVPDDPKKARRLLDVLAPHIEERQVDVVKGIGWGIKTIGKVYPDVAVPFLIEQLRAKKKFSRLMMRKALKYLPADKKAEVLAYV